MKYHGHQFRMARAATGLSTREICELASMSMRTLANIEAAHAIEYGVKQTGRFDELTIRKLVDLYEVRGIMFLPIARGGAGVRFMPV